MSIFNTVEPSELIFSGGDLSGPLSNPTVVAIDGYTLSAPNESASYPIILQYNGTGTALQWSGPIYGELACISGSGSTILTNKNQWYFINQWTSSNSIGLTANTSDGYFHFLENGIYLSILHICFTAQSGTQLIFAAIKNGVVDITNKSDIVVYGGITGAPNDTISLNHIDAHLVGDTVGLAAMQTNSTSPVVLGITDAHWDKAILR